MRAVRNVFPSARFVVFSTLEEVYMKTNRTKRSVFFCRAAALIALAAVCMIGCQNATDGSDGNSNGGGNTPQSAVEKLSLIHI